MKRWIAILLAALMLLGLAQAGAASLPGYTLDEKLYKQVKDGSGLKAQITFAKTPGLFSVLDEAGNTFVKTLLPGTTLNLRFLRGVGMMKGMQELEIIASREGKPLTSYRMLKDSQYEQMTCSLLGSRAFVDARGSGALAGLLSGQEQAWPDALGLLLAVNTAESSWQTAIQQKLDTYSVKTTLWLQTYTQTESIRDADNQLQNRITITVPANQVKAFIKQMLLDIYADPELLALLARELEADQAAAYLQPAMLSDFFRALDQLPLTGNLVSARLLDQQGRLLENQLVLPMGGAKGLDFIEYHFTAANGQTQATLHYLPAQEGNAKGAVTSLVMSGAPDAAGKALYTGTLSLQPEAGTPGFVVDPEEGDAPAQVYAFTLDYTPEPEVVDQANASSSRRISFALRVEPQGMERPAPQSLSGDFLLSSRQNSASATSFTGKLVWTDEGSQAQLTAEIAGNTAPPWNIPAIDPEGANRLDRMTAVQRSTLSKQVQNTLQSALASLMLRLSVPETSPSP